MSKYDVPEVITDNYQEPAPTSESLVEDPPFEFPDDDPMGTWEDELDRYEGDDGARETYEAAREEYEDARLEYAGIEDPDAEGYEDCDGGARGRYETARTDYEYYRDALLTAKEEHGYDAAHDAHLASKTVHQVNADSYALAKLNLNLAKDAEVVDEEEVARLEALMEEAWDDYYVSRGQHESTRDA
jgi:hypothetical protein